MPQTPEEDSSLHLFDEVVAAFNKHGVDYMVIGGFAVIYHGHVRTTEDLDLFVRRSRENVAKVIAALDEVSGGELKLAPEVFTEGKGVLLGEAPLRIDVLSQIAGVDFDSAWGRRETDRFGPETVCYLSREDLIANKRAAGRPQDLVDVAELDK
jgi:hypothetical protein